MNKEAVKSICIIFTILLLLRSVVGTSVPAEKNLLEKDNKIFVSLEDGYIDISNQEAWDLLSDISNGIQIPIDVRTLTEWLEERIDTPFPEDPRHFSLSDLKASGGVSRFIEKYDGNDVIIYCKGGSRSAQAAEIIADSEFTGIVYNMLGGLTTWKSVGLPYKIGNQVPNQPSTPIGTTICMPEIPYSYNTTTIDPDNDSIRFGWNWNGDEVYDEWTDFDIMEYCNLSHIWPEIGIYNVTVIAEDRVGILSPVSPILTVFVTNPPDSPTINSPQSAKEEEEIDITFSCIDPDGDDVFYDIKWEDSGEINTYGPYTSGDQVVIPYTWENQGNYVISAKARDVNGAESEWATSEIEIPKNKIRSPFVQRLIDLFPIFEKLIIFFFF